jgi:ribonuclease R
VSRRPISSPSPALPSREDVLAFLSKARNGANKRDIARAFELGSEGRQELKRILRDLADEGLIDKHGNSLAARGELPPVLLCDIIERDSDGDLIAVPAEWSDDTKKRPRILVIAARKAKDGPAPAINDRVLMKIAKIDGDYRFAGKVMKLIGRETGRLVGIFRATQNGAGRFVPVDKKNAGQEIDVNAADADGAKDGDLIQVDLTREGRFRRLTARVREKLGSIASEKAISLIALVKHGIPHVFPPEVLSESEAVKAATLKGREDWRDIPFVTIDPADAKDHDDAVHATPDLEDGNAGGFILRIAIADVAAYVRPGSAMDREALKRGNSVYFPDRVVPMLPERISNDLCSLRPNEDRPALGLKVLIDRAGRRRSHSFHRVMMRSGAKLAYQQAQAAIDGQPDELTGPLLRPVLSPLYAAYDALKRARDNREPLELDLPERKLILQDGQVTGVYVPQRLDAHRLIEEFMILSNVCAAETLEAEKVPLLYRVHDEPSLEKMDNLRQFLATVGIELPKSGALRPALFNRILARIKGTEFEALINEIVLRSQAQAEYAPENYGHFGLNLRRYAHFTSPIRRYADLVVHRALIRALALGQDGLADTAFDTLQKIGESISAAERRAMAAERETIDRLIAHHLADKIGVVFAGRITGVNRAGLFVRLDETGADGFIAVGTLGTEYYHFDEAGHAMTGEKSGESYRLGDRVDVKLVDAAPVAGALKFEMVSEGRFVPVAKGRRKGRDKHAGGMDARRARAGHGKAMARKGKRR